VRRLGSERHGQPRDAKRIFFLLRSWHRRARRRAVSAVSSPFRRFSAFFLFRLRRTDDEPLDSSHGLWPMKSEALSGQVIGCFFTHL
jgi:hypothetical protein